MYLPFALAALVVIPLAQVPLVMYLARFVELDPGERLPEPDQRYVTYGTASARPDERGGDSTPTCPGCGATVDDDYRYCGACATRLPPAAGRGRGKSP